MDLNWLRLKGKIFVPCLMESHTFVFFFFLLEACCLSLLPAIRFLRLSHDCECPCDMVVTTRTVSAKRFLEGHLGLVWWLHTIMEPPSTFQPPFQLPSCKRPAQGPSWPRRKCRDKKTSLLLTLSLRAAPLLGFLHRSQSNFLLLTAGLSGNSVTWTWKHPKSCSREIHSQREWEKKVSV